MSSQPRPSLLILLGIGCLAGGAVLAWYSSMATMRLERTGGTTVTVSIESRMFGLFAIGRERVDAVIAAALVRSRTDGSGSHTPDRIILETARETVDLGRAQQLFVRHFQEINAFVEDASLRERSISSVARRGALIRFVVAQLVVLFLAFCGVGLMWLGIKTLPGKRSSPGT